MKNVIKFIRETSILKTLYINLKYCSFMSAIKLPILIRRHTKLLKTNGKIIFDCPIKTGLIRYGSSLLGSRDIKYSRAIWEVNGTLIVKGAITIGQGSKICIGENAILTIGDNLTITGETTIICYKQIIIGNDCTISWDVLIMDTDFHHIMDYEGNIINSPKPIIIGNHVWIGCRNTILKNVKITDNVIVAANSVITKSINESNVVVGGSGRKQEIVKRNVFWKS